jgi:hypothetical protein
MIPQDALTAWMNIRATALDIDFDKLGGRRAVSDAKNESKVVIATVTFRRISCPAPAQSWQDASRHEGGQATAIRVNRITRLQTRIEALQLEHCRFHAAGASAER